MYKKLPQTHSKNRRKPTYVLVGVFAVLGGLFLFKHQSGPRPSTSAVAQRGASMATPLTTQTFDKTAYSIDEPGSLWWVVNKKRPLPDAYSPSDLAVPSVPLRLNRSAEQMQIRIVAKNAIESMFDAASSQGLTLQFASGFRSYDYQKQLYGSYVAKDGVTAADLYSARPGHSEHQTGLAFDVQLASGTCALEICFGDTDAGKWLAQHAHDYGFIIRYPNGKTDVTGYQYEPWHLRYVGKDLALEIFNKNITLEEFFGIDPAPTY